jgi:hypothetical protein
MLQGKIVILPFGLLIVIEERRVLAVVGEAGPSIRATGKAVAEAGPAPTSDVLLGVVIVGELPEEGGEVVFLGAFTRGLLVVEPAGQRGTLMPTHVYMNAGRHFMWQYAGSSWL